MIDTIRMFTIFIIGVVLIILICTAAAIYRLVARQNGSHRGQART